jgi:hypothetical protein
MCRAPFAPAPPHAATMFFFKKENPSKRAAPHIAPAAQQSRVPRSAEQPRLRGGFEGRLRLAQKWPAAKKSAEASPNANKT